MSAKRFLFIVATAALVSLGLAADTSAQVRRVRAPVRSVVFVPRYYAPLWYYDPWFYDPWFADLQWGGIYGPYGYPPYRYAIDPGAAVKLQVKPKQAEVYVDGYYAGIVDDFDGAFQRLRLAPGEHEIDLYLDGYRTVHQKVYLTPDNTFKLKYEMERLPAGEAPEARPQPTNPPPQAAGPAGRQAPGSPGPYPPPGQRGPAGPGGRRLPPPPPNPRGVDASAYGTLSIRVQLADADVVVDGEKWQAPQGQDRLAIEVPEGRHTVEISKAGYRSYVTDIDVRRGETTPLNVSLRSQEEQ